MTEHLDESQWSSVYEAPVSRLLEIGEATDFGEEWPDYPALHGLREEHVGELVRLACDWPLGDQESTAGWAPVHAARALGQLRADSAVPPMLQVLNDLESLDLQVCEFPEVIAAIGPAAIPHLAAFLSTAHDDDNATTGAIEGLRAFADVAECRDICIAILAQALGRNEANDRSVNGFLVGALLDFKAVEALDVIREAFARNAVNRGIAGDLQDAEIEFGLRQARSRLPAARGWFDAMDATPDLDRIGFTGLPARSTKVGRNAPCPCGSGKKYKKCCGDRALG